MTWKHNGKEIAYDCTGEKAPNDLWSVIIDLCDGDYVKAVYLLLKDCSKTDMLELIELLAEIHHDPSSVDTVDIQSVVDDIIYDICVLPSDEAMMCEDCEDKTVTVCGFTFVWEGE